MCHTVHVHLPEADFGQLRIWRPKEVSYRYDGSAYLFLLHLLLDIAGNPRIESDHYPNCSSV